MKLIISGDQHISIKKDLPLEWQLNRYRELWQTYVDLCTQHKAALVLTGDMYHNAKPSLYEVQLFLELVRMLEREEITTHIITGNHESMGAAGTTLDYFAPLFNSCNYVRYNTIQTYPFIDGEFVFVGHPYLHEWLTSADSEWEGTRILLSHFRPTVNQFIQEEIDVQKIMATCDHCFAGDIHMPLTLSDGKLVYTNSPLNTHFDSKPDCGCLLVTLDSGSVHWERLSLDLPNLIQITTTPNEYELGLLLDPKHFYRIEVAGSAEELRKIASNVPNVKLLKVPEEVVTYVDTENDEAVEYPSLDEELIAYMQTLAFSEQKIKNMMEVFYGSPIH